MDISPKQVLDLAAKIFVQQTDIDDAAALQMPDLFKTWEDAE